MRVADSTRESAIGSKPHRLPAVRTLYQDLSDEASAARDRDHLAEEMALRVVDLLPPQLCRLDVCDQHVTHGRRLVVNGASTIGEGGPCDPPLVGTFVDRLLTHPLLTCGPCHWTSGCWGCCCCWPSPAICMWRASRSSPSDCLHRGGHRRPADHDLSLHRAPVPGALLRCCST
jgi:hypothetical protein